MSKVWLNDYGKFISDMGMAPNKYTIERKNNNGDYTKKNCKWASRKEQANNTRHNRFILYNGETKTISEWIKYLKISKTVVYRRLKKGMSIDLAFIKGILK